MKKCLKVSFAIIMVVLVIALSCVSAFAASDLTINKNAKASKGDTVTYTLKLGECSDKLEGIQMYVFYDKDYLEIDAESLSLPELRGAVSNANFGDGIAFNWTSVTDLVSFADTKTLMTVDFKVKKTGKTDITYFITEMYGDDMTYFKDYTLTNDISVNNDIVVNSETPILSEDSALNNKYQGSFTNYADGKGERNGSGENHVAVTGVTTLPQVTASAQVLDVTKDTQTPITTIITILGVILVVVAIVIVIILRNHYSKKTDETEEKTE
ncbi:MAG: hypothetical protein J1E41_06100 [Ruminococcus sp.]|nr:hypothetical protein [Ruminococcus sp.]